MHKLTLSAVALVALSGGCVSGRAPREPAQAARRKEPSAPPKRYVCLRTTAPLTIDGRLDETAWAAAAWTDDFEDIEGARRPRPPLRTRAKMLWDNDYLYIAAELAEPQVWAYLTERDQIVFHDPDFEVFIDPNGDQREYYEIEINARNTIFDLFLVRTYIAGGPALHAWDCTGLRSAVHVDGTLNDARDTDRGWSLELALPWTTLKEAAARAAPPADGDAWRINFSRVEWPVHTVPGDRPYAKVPNAPEHNWVWSPQGVIDMHRPEHWGFVKFSTAPAAPVE